MRVRCRVLALRLTVLPPRNTLACVCHACVYFMHRGLHTRREYGVPHISYGNDRYDQTTKKPNGYGVCVLTVVVPCTVCPAQELRHGNGVRTERKSTGWIPSTHEKDIRGSLCYGMAAVAKSFRCRLLGSTTRVQVASHVTFDELCSWKIYSSPKINLTLTHSDS